MLSRVTSTAPADDAALRLLCESVYQPTDTRRDAILAYDWAMLPRVARALDALQSPVSPAAISDAARRLLENAVTDLAPSFPSVPGSVTPLEVVRMHILAMQPWPSLEAQLREEGRPVSRGTLIRRQHEFLPYLREWAAFDPAFAGANGDHAADLVTTTRATPSRRTRAFSIAAVVVLAALAIAWSALRTNDAGTPQGPVARMIPPDHMGRGIQLLHTGGTLPVPHPPLPLPVLEGRRIQALVIERVPGQPRVLIARQIVGDPAPHFCLWNPLTEEMEWESSYWPPPHLRLTHDGVGDEVLDQSYHVSRMHYAGPEGDLGRHVALGLTQNYSPYFFAFVDLDTGDVDGVYVHPGHLYSGAVFDFDGDGNCEVVLGGTDNVVHRPALVALRPSPGVRAASTVKWNEAGIEGAEVRVFLPPWPEAATAMVEERLGAVEFSEYMIDFHTRSLTVGVGGSPGPVYHVRLGPGLRPAEQRPLILWDKDLALQSKLGLPTPPLDDWVGDIVDVMDFARAQAQ